MPDEPTLRVLAAEDRIYAVLSSSEGGDQRTVRLVRLEKLPGSP